MLLNAQKCTVTKFTRNTVNFIIFEYKINNVTLEIKTTMKDLGVLFDDKLALSEHPKELYSKCIKHLGFIFRTCVDFRNPKSLITLFNSLIRSKLEYCSIIWSPHAKEYSGMIEKLQKKLVKFLFYRKLIHPQPEEFNYIQCCEILNIETLEKRRLFADLKILTRTFANQIDTQSFIHNINLLVPQRAIRNTPQFETHKSRADTGKYTVFNRLMVAFNTYGENCDIFFDNLNILLEKLKTNLNRLYKPSF